jgi:uncharacterized protein (TIGR03435 family)
MAELMAFAKDRKVLLSPEPKRMPRPEEDKPDFAPSYLVHISPAKDEDSLNASGPDYLDLKSFTLKALIQELYDVTPIRIQLPASLDDGKRYEVAMVLPEREDKLQMYARFRQGIEDYFHITARPEKRLMDVYVVTAPDGKPPAVKATPDEGPLAFSSRSQVSSIEFTGRPDLKPSNIAAIRGIALDGTTEQFCRLLEDGLDRPVVDETNLQGEYEFNIQASSQRNNDFLDRLHDQLGLRITPGQRTVEVLVIELHN